jgi:hypothetical protein
MLNNKANSLAVLANNAVINTYIHEDKVENVRLTLLLSKAYNTNNSITLKLSIKLAQLIKRLKELHNIEIKTINEYNTVEKEYQYHLYNQNLVT